MATFAVDGPDLAVRLSWVEKLEAFQGDVRVPLSCVSSVRTTATAWPELRGVRAPGTGVPGVVAVGTRRGGFGKDFAAVHGRGPAVVVELDQRSPYQRLVVTVEDAGAVAAMIRQHAPTSPPPAPSG